ncbi:MAG: MBL fold metallo-hydrolase, partial [Kiritimatiellia bacterium]|nr:MBL fold metallo-hydrolase [Kiritimatiellia bacterium]
MLLKMIKSEGIAHLSYILVDGAEAVVIDPRRDYDVYVELAEAEGARIRHIFETHRNEDYVIGSLDLARRTGATIHHGQAMDFAYGEPVTDGDSFEIGSLQLCVLETPGHT